MGTIRISRGATSVDLSSGITVEREVGRPGSELFQTPGLRPTVIDRHRAFNDTFKLGGALMSRTDAKTLREDILRAPLGTGNLTLEFVGTLWGLGSYSVVPSGSRSGRFTWNTGEKGLNRLDNLDLRVVSL